MRIRSGLGTLRIGNDQSPNIYQSDDAPSLAAGTPLSDYRLRGDVHSRQRRRSKARVADRGCAVPRDSRRRRFNSKIVLTSARRAGSLPRPEPADNANPDAAPVPTSARSARLIPSCRPTTPRSTSRPWRSRSSRRTSSLCDFGAEHDCEATETESFLGPGVLATRSTGTQPEASDHVARRLQALGVAFVSLAEGIDAPPGRDFGDILETGATEISKSSG